MKKKEKRQELMYVGDVFMLYWPMSLGGINNKTGKKKGEM
jgi:hypothetical protein